jgi:hypothetical protein
MGHLSVLLGQPGNDTIFVKGVLAHCDRDSNVLAVFKDTDKWYKRPDATTLPVEVTLVLSLRSTPSTSYPTRLE